MADKKIKVVMVEPGKEAYITEIETGLEDYYSALGCDMIEAVYPFEDMVCLVCDEEGKMNGSEPNRALKNEDDIPYDVIYGKFFICDCSGEDFGGLSDELAEKYLRQFKAVEYFF